MDALAFMVSARATRRCASVGCVGLWGKVGVALRPQPPPGKRLALACDVIARKAAAQAQRGLGSAADRTGRRPKLGAVGPATHRGTANAAPLPRTVKTQSPSSPWPRTQTTVLRASAWLLRSSPAFYRGNEKKGLNLPLHLSANVSLDLPWICWIVAALLHLHRQAPDDGGDGSWV